MSESSENKEKPLVQKAAAPTQKKTPARTLLTGALVLLGLVSLGAGAVLLVQEAEQNSSPTTSRTTVLNDGNKTTTAQEQTIDKVIAKSSPAVVSVLTQITVNNYFYGTSTQEGAGSGIIVSEDGIILTNKHVIDDANTVSVVLADGSTYENVSVLATDPLSDIAFLQIPDVDNLPVAELGDSSTVRVGQEVIAIGNSLGQYQNTVTSGIISGTGRPISAQSGNSIETLNDLLQTDAAINPGNSGGPLLNTSGQVIGINTAIIQDAEGIGFSIPINATKGMLKQILAGDKSPEHAYLGVRYVPVNAAVAKKFDLSVDSGAYVYADNGASAVVRGSPADKAGIKNGDVITAVNEVKVGSSAGVSSLVAEYAPGDVVEVTIVRDGQTKTFKVTLAAY